MQSTNRERQVVSLCRALIAQQSVSGMEADAIAVLRGFFESAGFDEVRLCEYGSLVGVLRGKEPGPRILFDAHIDTVPVEKPQEWSHAPFAAEQDDAKIYGRGASDMKGALSAMASAAAFYAEDTAREFAGEIMVSACVHEECMEGVAAGKICAALHPDAVIIGESTGLDLAIGQRGRAEIVLETFGKPAHSANPQCGYNAVYAMMRAIAAIRNLPEVVDPALGRGILELTDIVSAPYPGSSVVPDYCRATFDRRLVRGETRESVLAPLQEAMQRLQEEDAQFSAKVSYAQAQLDCYTGEKICAERFFPAWLQDAADERVQAVLHQLESRGFSPKLRTYQFCTNGSATAGEQGIFTVGLGPSYEHVAHTTDEYIDKKQLMDAVACYMGIMAALTPAR